MRLAVAAGLVVAASGCGRLRFDARGRGHAGDSGAASDGEAASPQDGAGTDGSVAAPSCAGLASTCGPVGAASCCATLPVPGGTFARGYDVSGDGMYPSSSSIATVSDFHLDTYEVTVGRFRQFVAAGMGTQVNPPAGGAGAHTRIANSGWDPTWNASLEANTTVLTGALKCDASATWTDTPAGNEHRPINCVTWYEAMAFCAWDGGYLPTEAEWNFAAAGGSEQRAYPWSSPAGALTIDCSHLDYTPSSACVAGGTSDVGSHSPEGDGRWGQADLAGNVFEWTLDWDAAYSTPCTDCADLTPSATRTLRGGDFGDPAVNQRTGYRGNAGTPTNRDSGVGIRCARP